MRIFVAGAAGALGSEVVWRLAAGGHDVTGLTRRAAHAVRITQAGARAVVGDALDSSFVRAAVMEAKPEVVVHALTAIPPRGPLRPSDLNTTNALRIHGTRHLLDAARAAGARRFVAESMVFVYGFGNLGKDLLTEQDPVPRNVHKPWLLPAIEALVCLETQVVDARHCGQIESVVLRFGAFYGPRAGLEVMAKLLSRRLLRLPKDPRGEGVPWIHTLDAAAAVTSAVLSGRPGGIYNIADDLPTRFKDLIAYLAQVIGAPAPPGAPMWALRLMAPFAATTLFDTTLVVSNAKAKRDLGWVLKYPSYREGINQFALGEHRVLQSSA